MAGEDFALKCYDLKEGPKQFERILHELNMLDRHQHPFIASMRGAFKENKKAYLVMPFYNGGNLSTASVTPKVSHVIMRQVCFCSCLCL